MPRAQIVPGLEGIIITLEPTSSFTTAPKRGPAPPYANREKSIGFRPLLDATDLIALEIPEAAIFTIPAAASSTDMPSGLAIFSSRVDFAALISIGSSPASNAFGFNLPSTKLASVSVISCPPLLYAIGPGSAPALWGPTFNAPPSSIHAMLPPPAPMALTSIEGDFIGNPAIFLSIVKKGFPSSTSDTSVLVPPTSNAIRLFWFASIPMAVAPTTPAAGPDKQVFTGNFVAIGMVSRPPFEWII